MDIQNTPGDKKDLVVQDLELESNKVRTPSGSVLPKKVQIIKELFSGEELGKITESDGDKEAFQNHSTEAECSQEDEALNCTKNLFKRKRRESPKHENEKHNKEEGVNT